MPKNWTEEDDKYLRDNWFESISQLAKKFEISDSAIKFRLKKLGINRPKGAQENIRLKATIYREKNKDKVPKEWHQLPSTRADAKKVKSFFYWDGQTCKRAGHLSRRKTSSAGCWACDYGDHKDKLSREPERREKRRKMFPFNIQSILLPQNVQNEMKEIAILVKKRMNKSGKDQI